MVVHQKNFEENSIRVLTRQAITKNPNSFYTDLKTLYEYIKTRRAEHFKNRDEVIELMQEKYLEHFI